MFLTVPLSARKERNDVGHDKPKRVQDGPGGNDPLEPGPGLIDGLAVLTEVHQQQGDGGGDDGGDGGNGEDLRVDVLHNLLRFVPYGRRRKSRYGKHGGHDKHEEDGVKDLAVWKTPLRFRLCG